MAAMFTDDSDELNKRYVPKDDGMYEDDEEYIPEEELTEEERESLKMFEGWTENDWQTIRGLLMDEEDYTLSIEEFNAKNVIARLNSATMNLPKDMIYPHKLWLANSLYPDEAFYVVERLKKKPEEGSNIPPEILDIIYKKAKEHKG